MKYRIIHEQVGEDWLYTPLVFNEPNSQWVPIKSGPDILHYRSIDDARVALAKGGPPHGARIVEEGEFNPK